MRLFALTALATVAASSPLLPRLNCPATSGGLTGPFYIQVSGEIQSPTTPGPNYDGDYAGTIPKHNLPFLVLNYASPASANVQEFYIKDSTGQLITDPTGTTNYAYIYPKPYFYVSLSTDPTVAGQITCSISAVTCAITCKTAAGQSTNCLGSPKYDPEWRIGPPSVVKPGCPTFTPTAVAA